MISQEIRGLTVDSTYIISGHFKPGLHAQIHSARPGTPCLAVDVDGKEKRTYIAPADVTNLERWDDKRWRSFAVPFKATKTTHTIRLRGEVNGSDCDVSLDNIAVEKTTKTEWKYEAGEEAPENWADLCHPFLECDGTSQSPIDLSGWADDVSLRSLEAQYSPMESKLIHNGHTIEFEVPEEELEHSKTGNLLLGNDDYKLIQFHFHSHSEHNVNGKYYPLEVHLVHKNEKTGKLAVMGVLFKAGKENAVLAKLIGAGLPTSVDKYSEELNLNPVDLLPLSGGYYTYQGSLTTPPCSEIVTWFVFDTPVEASQDQIARLAPLLHDDYRPLNPLNGRVIKHYVGNGTNPVLNNRLPLAGGTELVVGKKYYNPDQQYYLIWQADGNLVIYRGQNNGFVWGSYNMKKVPLGAKYARMQADGRLCIFDASNKLVWGTQPIAEGTKLSVNNQGQLQIISLDNKEIWNGSK